MTRQGQKQLEMHWASTASNLLGETWNVQPAPDEENWPDLCVDISEGRFGLEVSEIYKDKKRKGSVLRASESHRSDRLKDIAQRYYDQSTIPLRVDAGIPMASDDHILELLLSNAPQLNEWEDIEIREDAAALYIMRLPASFDRYSIWRCISDSVGWVKELDHKAIQQFIDEKSEDLNKYKTNIDDVRLLLTSNKIQNSGKQAFPNDLTSISTSGFDVVYLMLYPERVISILS